MTILMKKIFLFLGLGLLLVGCSEEFLDVKSETQISADNFWQSAADAQLAINGVYAALQARQLYGGVLNGTGSLFSHESLTDNFKNQWKWEGPGLFVEGNIDPTNNLFSTLWNQSYIGIARANSVIAQLDQLPQGQLDATTKMDYDGQARFLRALLYFNLAVTFEDVPLILEPQTLEDAYVAKNTQREVLDAIIADLSAAAAQMPASRPFNQYGYATQGAAWGLLARVYLFDQQYGMAASAAEQVMNLGYSLDNNYETLFTPARETSPEIIFSVRFFQSADTDNGETFSATFLAIPKVDHQPMPNLVKAYYGRDGLPTDLDPVANRDQIDPRLAASVWFSGDMFLTNPEKTFNGNTATGYGLKKYLRRETAEDGTGVFGQGSQDYYVLRYADVLLMRAEALIESGQTGQEVYDLINQVRQRPSVEMPRIEDVEGSGLSQEELRAIVRHERRVELAFEGLRFYDLKRWGELEAAYGRMYQDVLDGVGGYAPVYQGARSEVFPIPQEELDANPNLTQHPAW
ncbi:MAG: RagB/SusD family nutrient uptake outer membrane protein [Bacteroidetes bacterium]|nr:MAG: RagB/SusD family nutrient uptake outer membrane protein [Bacteroidota bacterium]